MHARARTAGRRHAGAAGARAGRPKMAQAPGAWALGGGRRRRRGSRARRSPRVFYKLVQQPKFRFYQDTKQPQEHPPGRPYARTRGSLALAPLEGQPGRSAGSHGRHAALGVSSTMSTPSMSFSSAIAS